MNHFPMERYASCLDGDKTLNDNEPQNYLRQITHPIMNQQECADDVKKSKHLRQRARQVFFLKCDYCYQW